MAQGISSAPEEFQRRKNEALTGVDGVEVIADDILCCSRGESMEEALADHDCNLENLLARTQCYSEICPAWYCRHDYTDNGPQCSSDQFATFTREWEFQHITSSPLHGQSNGKAESAVKIAKNLVKKAKREN